MNKYLKVWLPVIMIFAASYRAFGETSDVQILIESGDRLYEEYSHRESLEKYMEALDSDPENYEALWRISRAYERIGYNSSDSDEQESAYQEAMEYAQKAVNANLRGATGRYKLAVACGRMGLFKGGKRLVELSKQVREEAEKALEINPEYHQAYHVLAVWHYEVADLSWVQRTFAKILYGGLPPASKEKTVEYFKKAIDLNPEMIVHHLELGRVYKEEGEYELAAESFEKCLALPAVEEHDGKYKKEAEELYAEVQSRLK